VAVRRPENRVAHSCLVLLLLACGASAAAAQAVPLVDAVRRQDSARIRLLLAQRTDIDAADPDGTTALHWAVRADDLETAVLLLDAGANVDAANRYGITPLSLACTNGSAPMIARLLTAGADPDRALPEGETPLMTAARTGRVDALEALLSRGASVDARESWRGQTALMWAAAEGHAAAARRLIDAGADISARSTAGFSPLLFAVRDGHLEATRVLLDAGANPDDAARDGTSALLVAIINAHFELAGMLLDRGADPNVPDVRGSALHAVAWLRRPGWPLGIPPRLTAGDRDSLELARKLLAKGAVPDVRVAWKESRRGGFDLGMVVNNPPNIAVGRNYITLVGATPFYLAAKHSDVALMRLLAEHGADPLVPTVQGVTPLMAAVGIGFWQGESPGPNNGVPERDTLEAVRLAWELSGAVDVHARAHFNHPRIEGDGLELLHRLPLNVHEFDENSPGDMRWGGAQLIHGAAVRGIPGVIQFLVDKGADLTAKTNLGWTPLMIAEGMYIGQTEKEQPVAAAFIRKLLGLSPAPPRRPGSGQL
jgi:ankyrin repeat protein